MNPSRLLPLVLLLSVPAWAQVSTDTIAKVKADEARALKAIADKYAGKKLTAAERKQRGEEETAARKAVLQKHGVNDKELTRSTAKLNRAEQAKLKAKVEQLKNADANKGSSSGAAAAKTDEDASGGLSVEMNGGGGDEESEYAGEEDGADEEGGVVIEMPEEKN